MKNNKGFTLIELLVVIAIIGVLAALVTASINDARTKSRDAARKSQLKEIQTALELYYLDHNTYRVAGGGSDGNGWFNYDYSGSNISVGARLAADGYLKSEPLDPSGQRSTDGSSRAGYMIYITSDGQGYTLWANLEDPSAEDRATMDSCLLSTYDNYSSSYPAHIRQNYCVSS